MSNHEMIVVITGGRGGIASAIVSELVDYNVLNPTRDELDVCDERSVTEYFKGRKIDILINNAGFIAPCYVGKGNTKDQLETIQVNLNGLILCTDAALKNNPIDLIIINIGSSAGSTARAGWSSYCASKSAVIMLTSCWALEGLQVFCLSPGRTVSKMRSKLYPNEDHATLMKPKDFAKVVRMAIDGHFLPGCNINVSVQNVGDMIL